MVIMLIENELHCLQNDEIILTWCNLESFIILTILNRGVLSFVVSCIFSNQNSSH